jgi:hypothetical protein
MLIMLLRLSRFRSPRWCAASLPGSGEPIARVLEPPDEIVAEIVESLVESLEAALERLRKVAASLQGPNGSAE